MNLANWLVRSAKLHPENTALYRGAKLVSDYQGFETSAATIGASLQKQFNVDAGDRVAIFSKNSVEYLEAMYGIWYSGAAVVPINSKLHAKEAAWIIENCGANVVFVSPEQRENLAPHIHDQCELVDLQADTFAALKTGPRLDDPVEVGLNDMAWLFYTSGTTGRPKGVMISNKNIMAMAHSYLASVDNVYATDTALYAAPMSHGAGLYNVQHVLKAASHCVPESGEFNPGEIFDLAEQLGDLHMFMAPTMVKRLVDEAKNTGNNGEGIRTIVYGGGPMYVSDIIEAAELFGSRFCQIYGQGESPMTITALNRATISDRTHPRWKERLASVGTAQSSVEVAICDENGNHLPNGETGEIIVRGQAIMSGYWQNPKATSDTIRDDWLWTGDLGSMDEDGFLTLKDRSKDLIISGGSNIYPREVEEVLLTNPGVKEVSVIGKPDAEWGETVFAFVVLENGATVSESDLDQLCLDEIARFKRPKDYRFVSELPKNNYGKILKTELRKLN